ncbi:hypothetical protein [Tolumonas lignilytica]|uniref:hypothetical protein n=1 Tax=Tolumonas lignilytica TaxID=1283284 RepID=UPI000464A290|nr:hypothetical protein [Tolumonas lignilytica]
MNGLKQRYEELLTQRDWDSQTQIDFFLEYAKEYKLGDHFLAFLALKPATQPRNLISSAEYPTERLIELVVKNERITEIIQENALVVKDENPWTEQMMHKCINTNMYIDIVPEDHRLIKELLAYFNLRHASFMQPKEPQEVTKKDKTKTDNNNGDDYFEQIFKRYANFG